MVTKKNDQNEDPNEPEVIEVETADETGSSQTDSNAESAEKQSADNDTKSAPDKKDPEQGEEIGVSPGETYSISEVAEYLDIKESKIRYWDKNYTQFLDNRRNQHNHRVYTEDDVEVLERIQELSESGHYTKEGIEHILSGGSTEDQANREEVAEKLPALIDDKLGEFKKEMREEMTEEFIEAVNNVSGEIQMLRREVREELTKQMKQEIDLMTEKLMPPEKPWWKRFLGL